MSQKYFYPSLNSWTSLLFLYLISPIQSLSDTNSNPIDDVELGRLDRETEQMPTRIETGTEMEMETRVETMNEAEIQIENELALPQIVAEIEPQYYGTLL